MGRWIAAWTLLTFCRVTSSAWALTADDYVVAARAALFERTISGLVQAGDLFVAADGDIDCPDCADDRELIFLNAIARTAMLFVDHNDVLTAEGFFQLAETFGIPLDGLAFHGAESGDVGTDEGRRVRSRETIVGKVERALCETILSQLDTIVSDLDAIEDQPDPFVVYLVSEETGLADDLEVDYGDVLILKGLLLAYKGLLATQIAEDPNDAEAACSSLLDADACWQDIISTVLGSLAELDEDTAFLARARADWIDALGCCLAAAEYIASENSPAGTDSQEDEFVYIDPDAQPRLEAYRQTLAALWNSLATGAEAVEGIANSKTYSLQGTDSIWLGDLTLLFDLKGVEGSGGHLVLADGTALDVDWFGELDAGRIGVSMFSGPNGLEGWLEVVIDHDLGLIRNGTLELWGQRSETMTGLTGQIAIADAPAAQPDVWPTRDSIKGTVGFDSSSAHGAPSVEPVQRCFQCDWLLASWFEPPEMPIPFSRL
jgi:hypothetical protein